VKVRNVHPPLGVCLTLIIGSLAGTANLRGQSLELLRAEEQAFQAATAFAQRSVVQIELFAPTELGGSPAAAGGAITSGTVIDPDGWIVTSLHQLRGEPAALTVVLSDGSRHAAKIVARDFHRELALLRINPPGPLIAPLAADPSRLQIGQSVLALGKTFSPQSASCSVGILSATGRVWGRGVQADAKISPFNYGGALVDLSGRIIGLIVPLQPGIPTEGSVDQWYDSGIGFAVPWHDILKRLPQLQAGQDIQPGRLGLQTRPADTHAGPVVVEGITANSPAAAAGFRRGDVIEMIDRQPIPRVRDMRHALGVCDAGQEVRFSVRRDSQTLELTARLVDELPIYREPYLGVIPALAAADQPGVPIAAVLDGSPAAASGLEPGMWIVGWRAKPIDDRASAAGLQDNRPTQDRQQATENDDSIALPDRFAAITSPHQLWETLQLADRQARWEIGIAARGRSAEAATVERWLSIEPGDWPSELPLNIETLRRWSPTPTGPAAAAAPPSDDRPDPAAAQPQPAGSTPTTTLVEVPLGDVSNVAFALVPSTDASDAPPSGLLIVLPPPGPIDRTALSGGWGAFAQQYGWIVAVIESASPQRWSLEEGELITRVRQRLSRSYRLDPRRQVVGGAASGGSLALLVTMGETDHTRGLWLLGSALPGRLRLEPNQPEASRQLLMLGAQPAYSRLAEALTAQGHIGLVDESVDAETDWLQLDKLTALKQWLIGLERL
jgi:serine protease Do